VNISLEGGRMNEDNRKFKRFDCFFSGEAKLKNKCFVLSSIREFSREGIKLAINNYKSKPGQKIEIRVNIPWRKAPALIMGQVCWNHSKGIGKDIGVRISKLNNSVKSEILDYCYNSWREMHVRASN